MNIKAALWEESFHVCILLLMRSMYFSEPLWCSLSQFLRQLFFAAAQLLQSDQTQCAIVDENVEIPDILDKWMCIQIFHSEIKNLLSLKS